jgi:hypothetical protein
METLRLFVRTVWVEAFTTIPCRDRDKPARDEQIWMVPDDCAGSFDSGGSTTEKAAATSGPISSSSIGPI